MPQKNRLGDTLRVGLSRPLRAILRTPYWSSAILLKMPGIAKVCFFFTLLHTIRKKGIKGTGVPGQDKLEKNLPKHRILNI